MASFTDDDVAAVAASVRVVAGCDTMRERFTGAVNATGFRGLPRLLSVGVAGSLSELEIMSSKSKVSPPLLTAGDSVVEASVANLPNLLGFGFTFNEDEDGADRGLRVFGILADAVGSILCGNELSLFRGRPRFLFTGVSLSIPELEAALSRSNDSAPALSEPNCDVFREIVTADVDVTIFRGLLQLCFIAVEGSLSELERILSKSNDSPSLLTAECVIDEPSDLVGFGLTFNEDEDGTVPCFLGAFGVFSDNELSLFRCRSGFLFIGVSLELDMIPSKSKDSPSVLSNVFSFARSLCDVRRFDVDTRLEGLDDLRFLGVVS